MIRCTTLLIWLCAATLPACGGSTTVPERAVPAKADAPKGPEVYDAAGQAQQCEPVQQGCPPSTPDREFLDACKLAGYRVIQCGCEHWCTGQVKQQYYDAEGHAKPCAAAGPDCSPQVSAAFQDACIERGFKLRQCGCESLCSGNPTK